jgi:uncharacterized protein (TIGR00725 family)
MEGRKLIIGVVGHTGEAQKSDATLASEVGREITEQEAILLTGGEPIEGAKPVKDAAMYGAANHKNKKGRLISILPKGDKSVAKVLQTGKSSRLVVQTLLSSHERNVINGFTSDVVIALQGGPGTLSEIAFANHAKILVIFLDSLTQLQQKLKSHEGDLIKIINNAKNKYTWVDTQTIVDELKELFSHGVNKIHIAANAKDAVDKALDLTANPSNERIYKGKFPAIEPYTISQQI